MTDRITAILVFIFLPIFATGQENTEPAEPAARGPFFSAEVADENTGETALAIYTGREGQSDRDGALLATYIISPVRVADNTPAFDFKTGEGFNGDYGVRVMLMYVKADTAEIPLKDAYSDLFENDDGAGIIKNGGRAVFLAPKTALPEAVTLVIEFEVEYYTSPDYPLYDSGTAYLSFPTAIFR